MKSTINHFRWRFFFAAISFVATAAALRVWPLQVLGTRLAWLTFYPAVMVAALYGGFVPGLLATLLSCLAVLLLLPVFLGQPMIKDSADWLGLAVFAVTSTAISGIAEGMRRARVRERLAIVRSAAAEAALRESEALNRAVLDSMMANIAVVDREGTIIGINEGWDRFALANGSDATLPRLGVGANYLEVCKRAILDLGEEAQVILNGVRSVLEHSLEIFKCEYPCHSATEQSFFNMQVSPLAREEGGAVIVHINITERKRAEQLLADFKAALDEHAIVAVTDPRGKITYANDKFCAISKYSREELVGQDHRIVNSGHHPKAFIRELWETIASGRVWHGEIRNSAKDGSIYWVDTAIVPFIGEDGKPTQYIAIRADITELKRIEEALRESEERMRLATETASVGVWDWDIKSGVIKWDERMFVIYGLPPAPEGLASYEKDWRERVLPADLAETEAQLQHTVSTCGRSQREFRIVRAFDHAVRFIQAAEVAVVGADGKAERVVGINLDITERKEAEEQIVRLNTELRSHATELEAANKELESFSYSVSHDLRAPLRHIDGFVQLLAKREADRFEPASLHYLDVITAAVGKMGVLIDELLAFSRTSRQELRTGRVDLNELIKQASRELAPAMAGRTIKWEIGSLPAVDGDATLLGLVLTNLLSNAIKYTRERENARIEIGVLDSVDGQATIFVRDNGAGFDMQYADKLFGVFQRLHRQDEFEGVGIGLATVQRIVNRHGGRVWAEAEPDKGAAFYLELKKAKGETK